MQINKEYLILFLVCLFCHFLRTLYEVLKYKDRISPASKIIFGIMFVNMCLLWMSWFLMCETDTAGLKIPLPLRIAGLIVFAAGVFLFIYSLYRLRTLDDYRGELVRDGLFSVIRHPMYTGFIFWIIGYSVFQQSKNTILTSIIWILNILVWRYLEDRQLEKKYSGFAEYRQKTIF